MYYTHAMVEMVLLTVKQSLDKYDIQLILNKKGHFFIRSEDSKDLFAIVPNFSFKGGRTYRIWQDYRASSKVLAKFDFDHNGNLLIAEFCPWNKIVISPREIFLTSFEVTMLKKLQKEKINKYKGR